MNWNNIPIKFKQIIICLSFSIIPIITLGLLVYHNVKNSIYSEIREKIVSQANSYKQITESTFKLIDDQMMVKETLAKSIIEPKISSVQNFIKIYKTNPNMLKEYFVSMKIGKTGYVYILDYQGNYILSKNHERDNENIWNAKDSDNNYFIQNIIAKGKKLNGNEIDYENYYWKNIDEKNPRQKLTAILHEPELGWIIGVGTYYDEIVNFESEQNIFEDLKMKIKKEKVGKTGYMYVLNSKGVILVHPDVKTEGKDLSNEIFIQNMIKQKNGYIEYIWQGQKKVAGFSYYEPKDWIIASSSYLSDFTGAIELIKYIVIIISLIIIISGFIAAYFLSKNISDPIKFLAERLKMLSLGDMQISEMDLKKINVISKRKDELGYICNTFNKLSQYLMDKVNIADEIANGNFSIEVSMTSESDKLGKAFAGIVNALNESMIEVNNAVNQLSSGSNQVASASQALSQGATEQASSLEEITSSITEINSQAKQNSENALQANNLAKKTLENSAMGNKQMNELVESMANITKSADMIKKIVKVIDDIAFQTNLLALNANVEAARAGKYGKGFAVVAEEVRNLAGRSAESVKETTAMVEEAVKNIMNGNRLVDVTAKQLDEIASSANKVADLVEEIATASKEQTQGLEQINQGLGQIDQVTQANTANAEQSASAAEELSSQAQELKTLVAKFNLSDEYTSILVEDDSYKKNIQISKLQGYNIKKEINDKKLNRRFSLISKKAIEDALIAHSNWKKRLQDAVETGQSEYKVDIVKKDNACQFGQWLNSLSKEDMESEDFLKAKNLHAKFHNIAGEILELALTGKKEEAVMRMQIGKLYSRISGEMTFALNLWKNKL